MRALESIFRLNYWASGILRVLKRLRSLLRLVQQQSLKIVTIH